MPRFLDEPTGATPVAERQLRLGQRRTQRRVGREANELVSHGQSAGAVGPARVERTARGVEDLV